MNKLKYGKKTGLKYFDIKNIRQWGPCYDPSRYLNEDFRGTALSILRNKQIPAHDRLWVVLRPEIISEKIVRLFAVWAYRQTLEFVKNPDERSINAANVAEGYALKLNTIKELLAAAVSSYNVVGTYDSVHAVYDPASAHSASAAAAAAHHDARYAAVAAASSHASGTAYATLGYAVYDAGAVSAVENNIKNRQIKKLIEMITLEGIQRVKK